MFPSVNPRVRPKGPGGFSQELKPLCSHLQKILDYLELSEETSGIFQPESDGSRKKGNEEQAQDQQRDRMSACVSLREISCGCWRDRHEGPWLLGNPLFALLAGGGVKPSTSLPGSAALCETQLHTSGIGREQARGAELISELPTPH
ncbi:unnamed protein product [Pleuronectes platessa]|uniref:Uncharacterized protein n=1 Tax=Pleuronectes platessa TaxID=8262 RepID=A0A9N7YBP1_PLEPL|nr:unnamed protein product [Pleuronectes platessa]